MTVKLEGGKSVCPQIKAITDADPVMAHLGLTPQSVNAFGGFKVQGKTVEAAQQLIEDAKAVEEAGAFAVVLECVRQTCSQGNRGVTYSYDWNRSRRGRVTDTFLVYADMPLYASLLILH